MQTDMNIPAKQGLAEVVAGDITLYLNQFKDQSIGLRTVSERMGIHQKTLKRLISCQNKATYSTLYKIYRVLLSATDDSDLYQRCPKIVKEALAKGNPKPLNRDITYSFDLENEIARCSVFSEIYFTATAGPISREFIRFRFGDFGEKILERMLIMKVLICSKEPNQFYIGNIQANISSATIKKVGLHFVENYSKPENSDDRGENYSAFFIEGLSAEVYNQWLLLDEECFRKKIALTKTEAALGNIKAFTYMVTDTNNSSKARL
ncbi:MAG: hypothetical protein HN509_16130 [Halobacteriovoraceae bacterium]|jgi:hypothetical protein|nr:hypothetical protein [Halobacteriovoraceae bacterium]MBT5094364.1 hypothetical protein [Halobacteriovoraceae bacterium]